MPSALRRHQREGRLTVLVVDDEPDVRRLAEMMLKRSGHRVLQASNGREAVDMIAQRGDEIDVVLLDVMMPVMTGHEAIRELRRIDPELPVVFFSGYDRGEVAEHLSDPSAPTLFLPKPFTRAQLEEQIEAARNPTH